MAQFNINSLKEVLKNIRPPEHANDVLELYLPDRLDNLNLRDYANHRIATCKMTATRIVLVAEVFNRDSPYNRWYEWALYVPTVEVKLHEKGK